MSENIKDIEIFYALLADFISEEFSLWQNDSSNFIEKPQVHESLQYAFDKVIAVCADSTRYDIKENVATFLSVYAISLESDLLNYDPSDIAGIISRLNDINFIENINTELSKNRNFSSTSFSSVAMWILTKQIDYVDKSSESYEILMNNMSEAISTVQTRGYGSTEEKLAVLTSYTEEYFADFGIGLSDKMAKYNSDVFLDYFASRGSNASPEEIEELFDRFRTN